MMIVNKILYRIFNMEPYVLETTPLLQLPVGNTFGVYCVVCIHEETSIILRVKLKYFVNFHSIRLCLNVRFKVYRWYYNIITSTNWEKEWVKKY